MYASTHNICILSNVYIMTQRNLNDLKKILFGRINNIV